MANGYQKSLKIIAMLTVWVVGLALTCVLYAAAVELLLIYPLQDFSALLAAYEPKWQMMGGGYDRLAFYVHALQYNWLLGSVLVSGMFITAWVSQVLFADEVEDGNIELTNYYLQQERKKVDALNEEISQREEKLLQLYSQVNEGLLLVDSEMRVLFANKQALDLIKSWGSEDVQLLQQPMHALFPGFASSGFRNAVQSVLAMDSLWEQEVFLDRINRWLNVRLIASKRGVYCFFRDVSHRKLSDEDEKHQAAALRAMSKYTPKAFAVVDKSWRYLQASDVWADIFKLGAEGALEGQSHRMLLPRFPGNWQELETKLNNNEIVEQDSVPLMIGKQEEMVSWRAAPWVDRYGHIAGYLLFVEVVTDVYQAKKAQETRKEKEHQLAYHDILTGLPNRQMFYDRLNMSLAQAYRHLSKVSLMFLDLDGFKAINDNLGHDVGDMLLKEVSNRLQKCVRQTDTVARLGGDEFTIILTDVGDATNAENVAKKLIHDVAEPYMLAGNEVKVSTSIGVAMYPSDATNMTELIKKADTAMYRAKNSGKNGYKFFETSADAEEIGGAYEDKAHEAHEAHEAQTPAEDPSETRKLEADLYKALQRGELELYFQPKYNLERNTMFGLEALLRWNHPDKGVVGPMEFLPLAERSGLILPIGEWVMRTAALRTRQWLDMGIPPELSVVVNLSARQLHDASLGQRVQSIIEKTDLPPKYLGVEISEETLFSDIKASLRGIEKLKEQGLAVVIYGVGDEVMDKKALKTVKPDMIKIDMGLIHRMERDKDAMNAVKNVIKLAKNCGVDVMAGGIESPEQLELLRAEGCMNIQGYLIGKPAGYKKVPEFFRSIYSDGRMKVETRTHDIEELAQQDDMEALNEIDAPLTEHEGTDSNEIS